MTKKAKLLRFLSILATFRVAILSLLLNCKPWTMVEMAKKALFSPKLDEQPKINRVLNVMLTTMYSN